MPKKSKEELLEKDIIDSKKSSKTKPSTVKEKATKKTTTKATTKVAKAKTSSKTGSIKSTSRKNESNKTNSTKTTTRKSATTKTTSRKTRTTGTKKTTKVVKKAKLSKRTISSKISKLSSKTFTKSMKAEDLPFILEYYDLPYKYNKTVIKALAQNPNTLFVYWEISDEDIQNLKENYGEDFFNTTRPVLIIHNLTDKYSFEIDINDFANNWYIHVNDTKCQYVIELGRRPKEGEIYNLPDNYLYVTSSNMIESPNDHVLFFDSEAFREVKFKNIHTNKYTTKVINPFLKNMYELYKSLHLNEENVSFDFKNPSSQNPTSNVF